MVKRIVYSLIFFLVLILVLGFGKGFSNLLSFLPIFPPLIAIALAFITHEVVISLFVGIFISASMTLASKGFFAAIFLGFFKSVDTYVVKAVADTDHVSVIIFTLFIGGVIGLVGKSGGLQGIVFSLSKYAKNAVLAQFYAWAMGILIFFDDYANSLIVGNTMRPLTDKFKVSREKLSFIVDATAAPVSSLVLVSTWIGYEIGLIGDVFKANGITYDPYMSFIYSVPFRFYVIFMLLFIPMIIFMKRDMFSMFDAEKRARETGETLRPGSIPITGRENLDLDPNLKPNAWNAIIPIAVLIFGVLVGLYITGEGSTVREILGSANSFKSLIWASFTASVVAMLMIVFQKIMTFQKAMGTWIEGMKSMGMAMVILVLAWSLGGALKDIKTAETVTHLVSGVLSVSYLPFVIFFVSSVIAFATGTSWGSMAILFPIAVPLCAKLAVMGGLDPASTAAAMYATIGAILSGTVFGDHCSPISDTTILSSIACHMDHMDHVETQMPYALLVGLISIFVGYLPAGFGFSPMFSFFIGLGVMGATIYFLGKKVEG